MQSYVVSLIFMLALFTGGSAQAASACKGLSQSKCGTNCTWVGSYKTKAGNKVNGYCRAKSGKAAAAGVSSKAKSKVNKIDKKASGTKKSVKESSKKVNKAAKKSEKKASEKAKLKATK